MKNGKQVLGWMVLIVGLCQAAAWAQAGPALILKPWRGEQYTETKVTSMIFASSETETVNGDFDLRLYEGAGRARFDNTTDHGLAIGFDLIYMDIDSNDPRLPDQLSQQRLGAGLRLGEWEDWVFDIVAGVGFAGDSPYGDGDAWYGHATGVATYKVDEKTSWVVMLNYDGNRAIFPDIPLPAVAYRVQHSETLVYQIGLPVSTLYWRPYDPLVINATFAPPYNINLQVFFFVSREWRLFAAFKNEFNAFHVDGSYENDRLFFQQRRAEGGIKWVPCNHIDFEVAGGFAFDQEFSTGYHALDTNDEFEVDDTPYIRAAVKVKF